MSDDGMDTWFRVHPEVAAARVAGRGLVALESTLISHGLPWPDNREVALASEAAVRDGGGVPATVAVMDGKAVVGMTPEEIESLAKEPDAWKLSIGDVAASMGLGQTGAVTVAATIALAQRAGLEVFATGGLGGVHRGLERDLDISADLAQLARGSMVVVCAGAKAILDLARTREVLETLGVTVLGWGTEALPGFWVRDAGLRVDRRVDTPEEVVSVFRARRALGLAGCVVVAQPAPEDGALSRSEVEGWIREAMVEAPGGKEATPYMLARIAALSGGRSLALNKRLIIENARLGGRIAAALVA